MRQSNEIVFLCRYTDDSGECSQQLEQKRKRKTPRVLTPGPVMNNEDSEWGATLGVSIGGNGWEGQRVGEPGGEHG